MRKVILLSLLFFLTACSNNNHIESDLMGATDAYFDINKIYHCTIAFSVKESPDDSFEIIDDIYDNDYFESSKFSKELQKSGFLMKKDGKFYFTDKINKFFKIDKDKFGIKKVHFCNGIYKVTDILNIPEYAGNNPNEVSASFKAKIDYFDWFNENYDDEIDKKLTSDITNSFVFDALYKKTSAGWELFKIRNYANDSNSFSKSFQQLKKLDGYNENEMTFKKYFTRNLKNNFGLSDDS